MRAPILIGQLELTEPIADRPPPVRADGVACNGVQLLVRVQHVPVGYVLLAPAALRAEAIARHVWRELAGAINGQRYRAGLPALGSLPVGGIPVEPRLADDVVDGPLITVVLCTRDRPDGVVATLHGLAAMRYRPFEVVVVDHAPSSEATRDAIAREFGGNPRIRYVREPRPGLSRARNRGLAEVGADLVAFTDDDVRVDPWWLNGIARGFRAAPDVACVTGLIATAELDNPAQLYFHLRERWGPNVERRVFDLAGQRDDSPLYPYSAGVFGAGPNFAVSRVALKEIGGFDEALGAGTPAGGGEDLNLFMRVILAGQRLVYEPSAIVEHVHRTDPAELARQLRTYGSGCTAALTAIFLANARARRELPPKVVSGVLRMLKLNRRVRNNPALPAGMIRQEAAGFLEGPWLYLKGRRHQARRLQVPAPRNPLDALPSVKHERG